MENPVAFNISIDWFSRDKLQENPMIFIGKSMVSGSDFPFFVNPLMVKTAYQPLKPHETTIFLWFSYGFPRSKPWFSSPRQPLRAAPRSAPRPKSAASCQRPRHSRHGAAPQRPGSLQMFCQYMVNLWLLIIYIYGNNIYIRIYGYIYIYIYG